MELIEQSLAVLIHSAARLLDFLAPFTPSLVSFVLGYGLFELQERRKRALEARTMRDALLAELRHAEEILSTLVTRFSFGMPEPADGFKELRWYAEHKRATLAQPSDFPEETLALAARSDDELTRIFRAMPRTTQPGLKVPLPTIEGALQRTAGGLSREQFLKLGEVKWQSHLLAVVGEDMREWTRFTFTVEDPDNRRLAQANFDNARTWYGKRARYALDTVREALTALESKNQKRA